MAKITYVFGAGASCIALPTINGLEERIQFVIDLLQLPDYKLNDSPFTNDTTGKPKSKYQEEMVSDLKWLLDETRNHATVDTFARKLFLKRDGESKKNLRRLKIVLSIYFHIEQSLEKNVHKTHRIDPRYDTFFASVLGTDISDFPKNLNIISWNYDMQFEMAYSSYVNYFNVLDLQDNLNIFKKNEQKPKNKNGFGIIKLNGTAGLIDKENGGSFVYSLNWKNADLKMMESIIEAYATIQQQRKFLPTLSFAWENEIIINDDRNEKGILEHAKEMVKDTEILIFIGYSLPFFNRTIDREIINAIPNLKKVYIQDPDNKSVMAKFLSIRPEFDHSKIVPIDKCSEFYLPHELD